MDVETVLNKYDLERETVKQYVEAITYLNQTEAAEKIGVTRQTIYRHKKAFQEMTTSERTLLIATLTQEKLLEENTKGWTPHITDSAFQVGDRVKLILDKEKSPDNHLHGQTGEIVNIEFDNAQSLTGNSEDNFIYTIRLENGEEPDIHFRRHDLKKLKD